MNRRGFFGALFGAAAAAATLDPEKLLWVPGAKLISIPAPVGTIRTIDWITKEALRILANNIDKQAAMWAQNNNFNERFKVGETIYVPQPRRFTGLNIQAMAPLGVTFDVPGINPTRAYA